MATWKYEITRVALSNTDPNRANVFVTYTNQDIVVDDYLEVPIDITKQDLRAAVKTLGNQIAARQVKLDNLIGEIGKEGNV